MKKLALIIHGGIGTGEFAQGFPLLEKLVIELSVEYQIHVYSHSEPARGFKAKGFEVHLPTSSTKLGRWWEIIRMIRSSHRNESYRAIVAVWGFPAGFVAALTGSWLNVPSMICLMGGDAAGIPSINFGILHKPLKRLMAFWAYRNATHLVTLSDFQRVHLQRAGLSRQPVVIPWGAPHSYFTFHKKNFAKPLRLLHIGHISPVKDQLTLLKALAFLRQRVPCTLTILGGDTMDGALQRNCELLGLQDVVRFEGVVPYDSLDEWFERSDVLLVTSLYEGQCMAVVEAASAGLLLAGTRVGVLHDLGNSFGIVVEPGQAQELSDGIIQILQEPEKLDKIVMRSYDWAMAHSLSWTAAQWRTLLNSN